MDYRSLEINVSSLEGLEPRTNLFFKTRIYAVVSVITTTAISRQKTPLGKYVRKNHEWDYPMKFYVEELKLQQNSVVLMIQLRKKRPFCIDNDVGEVYVPLKELFDDPQNDTVNNPKLGVYPVVTASGKPKGHVYFSYRFNNTFRGAVRNSANEDTARLTQLRWAARRAVCEPSAPYIGTNPVYQMFLYE